MPQFIQGADGKFKGSVGEGKTRIPAPSDITLRGDETETASPVNLSAQAYLAYMSLVPSSFRIFDADSVQADPEKAVKKAVELFYSMQDDARHHILNEEEFTGSGWIIDTEYDVQGNEIFKTATAADGSIRICWKQNVVTSVTLNDVQGNEGPIVLNVDADGKLNDNGDEPASRSAVSTKHYRHGVLHCANGPAVLEQSSENDSKTVYSWYENGAHLATVTADGKVIRENGEEIIGAERRYLGVCCAKLNELVRLNGAY